MQNPSKHPGIQAAIDHFGSQAKLAAALSNWSQQTISRVLNGRNRVSAELAIDIEKATRGAVPRWTLRPDIFSIRHFSEVSAREMPMAAEHPVSA